jgi:uncharacterized pyridoxamine 5'-phosphate oxidase family protein
MIKTLMLVGMMGCTGFAFAQEAAVSKSYVLVKDQAKDALLEEMATFLETNNAVLFLATVNGDKPCVRPVRFTCIMDNKLAIVTSLKKGMSAQMKANPAVEISTVSSDGKSYVRFAGKAALCTDQELVAKHNELHPKFKGSFKTDFALYLVTPEQVGLWGGKEPKTKTFEGKK